jgi:hypothetical protein
MMKPFYGVMNKYEKHFSEHGVRANLIKWEENKFGLAALLRNHPAWDEDSMAVILPLTENRGIDRETVDQRKAALLALTMGSQLTNDEQTDLRAALTAATDEYSELLSEGSVEIIKERSGIKCVAGQKATRVIGKLCQKYGVDRHVQYNSIYPQLADSLSPRDVQKKALLSVHPCAFLEMADKNNSWSSCHNLMDGGYQSGCLSYMNDSTTIMFYTVDGNVTSDFCTVPKRNRQVFCYAEGMLLQSRLYPNINDMDAIKQYRSIVQEVIAACLGVPNRWVLKKKSKEEKDKTFVIAEGSRQYPDYDNYGTISTLKGLDVHGHIIIGGFAYCVCCGKPLWKGHLKCHCEDKVVCHDCGKTVPANGARYHNGTWLCCGCLLMCAACSTVLRDGDGNLFPAFDKHGNVVHICENCYENTISPCRTCSVQVVCPSSQSNRFCQRTAVAA